VPRHIYDADDTYSPYQDIHIVFTSQGKTRLEATSSVHHSHPWPWSSHPSFPPSMLVQYEGCPPEPKDVFVSEGVLHVGVMGVALCHACENPALLPSAVPRCLETAPRASPTHCCSRSIIRRLSTIMDDVLRRSVCRTRNPSRSYSIWARGLSTSTSSSTQEHPDARAF
jgi:hypothetical protein